jgi:diaminohydroxyphosphoribosylaminopyrimidine deaminase/5-amino-6-(5-phosphoribosylamino)uracil reductase
VVTVAGEGSSQVVPALDELGRREITSLLLEGGPTLAGAFLDAGEVDRLCLFVAPLVIGGSDARPAFGGLGAKQIADAQRALEVDHVRVGEDLLIDARMREW